MIKEKNYISLESVGQVGACSLRINNKTQLKTTHRSASQNGNWIFLLEVSSKQTGNIKWDIGGLRKEKKNGQYTTSIIDMCNNGKLKRINQAPALNESDCGAPRPPPPSIARACAQACLPSRHLDARRPAHQRISASPRTWPSASMETVAGQVQFPCGSVSASARPVWRGR